jgi:hypothetical protein
MGSKRIRITAKRRPEVDVEALVRALIRLAQELQEQEIRLPATERTGGAAASTKESAA